MAPGLAIRSDIYYDAAQKLSTLSTEIGTAVTRDLAPALTTTTGMAGNYLAAVPWATAYLLHASEIRTFVQTYADALRHYSDIINAAGFNWDTAEYNADSNPSKGASPSHPARAPLSSIAGTGFPDIPCATGDNGPGVVINSTGISSSGWTGAPNARADALDTAASGWETFSNSQELSGAAATLQTVHDSFAVVQADEVRDLQMGLVALRGAAQQISTVAMALADATRTHHTNLLAARQKLSTVAATTAFPAHPDATVATAIGTTSMTITVDADLIEPDIGIARSALSTALSSTDLYNQLSVVGSNRGLPGCDALTGLRDLQAIQALAMIVESGNEHDNAAIVDDLTNLSTWTTPAPTLTLGDSSALDAWGPQMKAWAIWSVQYGHEAGVDPRMVLAMALQEGAPLRSGYANGNDFHAATHGNPENYHPDSDKGILAGYAWDKARRWATPFGIDKNDAGNSIGLTNQKPGPFNEVKDKYPAQFEGQEWADLTTSDELGIKAAAYNLRMLQDVAMENATPEVRASTPLNQFLGSGYNAGGMVQRTTDVAAGGGTFSANEVEHGQSTLEVFKAADNILRGSGAYY
ncbi:hypothetical protein [Nocardia canadensis]|uniref:hypothetical protein n=1 Tax=Nocardia canadensis TaxID=3065238 RepID=UPI00292DCA64|nr:hypothetical protein [Nocardia canadensis]